MNTAAIDARKGGHMTIGFPSHHTLRSRRVVQSSAYIQACTGPSGQTYKGGRAPFCIQKDGGTAQALITADGASAPVVPTAAPTGDPGAEAPTGSNPTGSTGSQVVNGAIGEQLIPA